MAKWFNNKQQPPWTHFELSEEVTQLHYWLNLEVKHICRESNQLAERNLQIQGRQVKTAIFHWLTCFLSNSLVLLLLIEWAYPILDVNSLMCILSFSFGRFQIQAYNFSSRFALVLLVWSFQTELNCKRYSSAKSEDFINKIWGYHPSFFFKQEKKELITVF